jgi:hypothetical protein
VKWEEEENTGDSGTEESETGGSESSLDIQSSLVIAIIFIMLMIQLRIHRLHGCIL